MKFSDPKSCLRWARSSVLLVALSFPTVAAGQLTTLYTFAGPPDGASPQAALISDASGNLYGTTIWGGIVNANNANGNGTVFKLTPNGNGTYSETVLYKFTGGNDGGFPSAALIADASGNLYGTTEYGGASGNGTVFKLTPAGVETVLYSFKGQPDGSRPLAGLIFGAGGNLYGTTEFGGSSNDGTVFMVTMAGAEIVLYNFVGGTDGQFPVASLLQVGGNLFGTTQLGGSVGGGVCGAVGLGCGTVFELTPSGPTRYTETVLYRFSGGDGADPVSGVVSDAAGNLYGTTSLGGNSCPPWSCGTVFRLAPGANGTYSEAVLYAFKGTGGDGVIPKGGVIADAVGNLYGTTYWGGTNGDGSVFKLAPSATPPWTETVLASFVDGGPGNPAAGLFSDGQGNFYGTTLYIGCLGSGCGYGAVFKIVIPLITPTCTDNSGGTVQLGATQFVPCPAGQVGTSSCPSVSPVVGPGLPDCGTEKCIAQNTWSTPDFGMCGPQVTCIDNSGVTVQLGAKQFVACPQGEVGTTACPSLSPVIGPGLPDCATEICQAQNTWSSPPNSSLCDVACTDGATVFPVGATESRSCTGGQLGTQTRSCNPGGHWGDWTGACQCPAGQLLCFNGLTHANVCFTPLGGITDNTGVFHAWCGHEDQNQEIDCSSSCPATQPCAPAHDNVNHIQTTDLYCGDGSIGPKSGGGSDAALLTFLALMGVWSIAGLWRRLRRRASR